MQILERGFHHADPHPGEALAHQPESECSHLWQAVKLVLPVWWVPWPVGGCIGDDRMRIQGTCSGCQTTGWRTSTLA